MNLNKFIQLLKQHSYQKPPSVRLLSKLLGKSVGTIHKMYDKAEEQGLIKRYKNPFRIEINDNLEKPRLKVQYIKENERTK